MTANRALMAWLAVVALPAFAAAQGLGDEAARARARRAKTEAEQSAAGKKVYSNEDLAKGRSPKSEGAAVKGQSAPSDVRGDQVVPSEGGESQGPSATELIEQRAAREKQFEAAVETARARVHEIEQQANTLAERLNPMSTTFVYGAGGTLDVNEEPRIRAELQQMPARLEEARRAVTAAEDALTDFRNGRTDVVPGGRPEPPAQ